MPTLNHYQRYNNIIINKSSPLGSGNYGNVYRGYLIDPDNNLEPVAIKQSYNQSQNLQQIQTLRILNHPNIVKYRDYTIHGEHVYMVMELCSGGTLDDLLYRLGGHDEGVLLGVYGQILRGIEFMYAHRVLHRDLKPSNILVDARGVVKIADFGTSKIGGGSGDQFRTLVGTPLFFSPELLEMSLGEEDTYTEKSEIWALGLILYFMFNYDYGEVRPADRVKQSLPWTGGKTSDILKNIKNEPLLFRKPERVLENIRGILRKMLTVNVHERMGFQQLFQLQIFNRNPILKEPHIQVGTQQCTITYAKKEAIDWELMQLLARQEQTLSMQEDTHEQSRFYEMIMRELVAYGAGQFDELVSELKLQLEAIAQGNSRSQQRESKQEGSQKLSPSSFIQNTHNSQGTILSWPTDRLQQQCRRFIGDTLPLLPLWKPPGQVSEHTRRAIHLTYDMLTVLTMEKSWQMKRKAQVCIEQYQKVRRTVSLSTLLHRIAKAAQCLKLCDSAPITQE